MVALAQVLPNGGEPGDPSVLGVNPDQAAVVQEMLRAGLGSPPARVAYNHQYSGGAAITNVRFWRHLGNTAFGPVIWRDVTAIPRVYQSDFRLLAGAEIQKLAFRIQTIHFYTHFHRSDLPQTPFNTAMTLEWKLDDDYQGTNTTVTLYQGNTVTEVGSARIAGGSRVRLDWYFEPELLPPGGEWTVEFESKYNGGPGSHIDPRPLYPREFTLAPLTLTPEPYQSAGGNLTIQTQASIGPPESALPASLQAENMLYKHQVAIVSPYGAYPSVTYFAQELDNQGPNLSVQWDGRDRNTGLSVPNGTYRVLARAIPDPEMAPELLDFPNIVLLPSPQLTQEKTLDVGGTSLRIENGMMAPPHLTPGEPVKFDWDLQSQGFQEPLRFEWDVTVFKKAEPVTPRLNIQAATIDPPPPFPSPFYRFPHGTSDNPGPYNVTGAGLARHISVPWDGKNSAGNTIDQDFEWVIDGKVTDATGASKTVQRKFAAPAGSNELVFIQNGQKVTSVKPSFLFQVHQWAHNVTRVGAEPGHEDGNIFDLGQPSQVELRFTLKRIPPGVPPTFPMDARIELEPVLLGSHDCGHAHSTIKPTGIFLPSKLSDGLSEADKRQRITELYDSIELLSIKQFTIPRSGASVSLFYLAPLVAGDYKFAIRTKEGATLVSQQILHVTVPGLESMEDALRRNGVTYLVDDPTKPLPAQGSNMALVTGQNERHPRNHYGPPGFNDRVAKTVRAYYNETKEWAFINDQSLECGGKFEIDGNYRVREKHYEHRLGTNQDITAGKIAKAKRNYPLEKYAKQNGLAVYIEFEGIPKERHYHLRPLEEEL